MKPLNSKAFCKQKPWEKTLNNKGQIFSTDLMLASIVFLFILVLSIIYSAEIANRVNLLEEDNSRNLASLNAANGLLLSEGNPGNWENLPDLNNVSSIGIAKTGNEIHAGKLKKLLDLNRSNYEGVKNMLGVQKYGLGISILRLQNSQSLAEFGLQPTGQENTSSVNRIAFYNGEEVLVRVKVFE